MYCSTCQKLFLQTSKLHGVLPHLTCQTRKISSVELSNLCGFVIPSSLHPCIPTSLHPCILHPSSLIIHPSSFILQVSSSNTIETYTGSTYRTFHTRYLEHMNDIRNPSRKGTTLSGHIWFLKGLGVSFDIKWEIVGRAQPFNPATGQCRLCLLEKYHIMFNKVGASLNQRTEFFSHCYHKAPLLLTNQKFT